MINRFSSEIQYEGGEVAYVSDPSNFVFDIIYTSYAYKDSVLDADRKATTFAGSTETELYYSKLWELSQSFTVRLFESASLKLATLIYTTWINAGQPTPETDIYDVQQNNELVGENVTVTGIVTAASGTFNPRSTFLEDPQGGPWSGVLCWDPEADLNANEGDEVLVSGVVEEYYGMTEISVNSFEIISTGNTLPPVVPVSTVDIATGSPTAESYEGVLVEVSNVIVVDNSLGYGEWLVDDGSGACRIDDDADDLSYDVPANGTVLPYIRGVLNYNFDNFKLEPRYREDIGEPTNVADSESTVPQRFELSQNHPNPFNPNTKIEYRLPEPSHVAITIYDIQGKEVKRLVNSTKPAGHFQAVWDGRSEAGFSVAGGVYFYRMVIVPHVSGQARVLGSRKMLLIK